MHKTEAEGEVLVVSCDDMRHSVGIPLDPDLGLWSGQHDAAIGLRQGRAKVQIESATDGDQQQRKEACPDPDPAAPAGKGIGGGSH